MVIDVVRCVEVFIRIRIFRYKNELMVHSRINPGKTLKIILPL